jgi:hypothetical protein
VRACPPIPTRSPRSWQKRSPPRLEIWRARNSPLPKRDYSPSDIATLLQSGGIELLEVKTLMALRDLESVIRGGLMRMKHYEALSDELIAPNLDQDISFFYDPVTKKLRKRFEKYPDMLQATVDFFHELERTQAALLAQIQAERRKR